MGYMKILSILLLTTLALAGITESYYELLGVERTATEDQIKKAFKKKSLEFHPDRQRENRDEAQKMYSKISTAYDVLMDPEKRAAYDRAGEKGVSDWEQTSVERKRAEEWRRQRKAQNRALPGLYGGTDVFEVEETNQNKLKARNVIWLANFYHPTCGHCIQYKAEYAEIAKKLAGIIVVAAINCSSNFDLCQDMWIQEYPTVILFPADPSEPFFVHRGDRGTATIMELVSSHLQSYIRPVTKNSIEDFLERNLFKLVYFHTKRSIPQILKFLSMELIDKVVFGDVMDTDIVLTARFEITEFPTIIGISAAGVKSVYSGEMRVKPMLDWILTFSGNTFGKSPVEELTPDVQAKGLCTAVDPTICVIVFAEAESSLAVLRLKVIAGEFKKDRIAFFWVDSKKYKETFARFRDTAGVVLKARKNKIMGFKEVEELADVLSSVVSGGGDFQSLTSPLVLQTGKTNL